MSKTLPLYLSLRPVKPTYAGGDTAFGHVLIEPCIAVDERGQMVPRWQSNLDGDVRFPLVMASAQIDSGASRDNLSYGWTMGMRADHSSQHALEFDKVESVYQSLKRLATARLKTEQRLGQPKSFGQFVMWHFDTFKVAGIFIYRDATHFKGWQLFGTDLAHAIDAEVWKIAVEARKLVGKGDEIPAGRD